MRKRSDLISLVSCVRVVHTCAGVGPRIAKPTRFLNTRRVSCVKSRRLDICIYGIGVYTPVAFVQRRIIVHAPGRLAWYWCWRDSATPSTIVNQSACTEPFPVIRAYPCLTRVELRRVAFRVLYFTEELRSRSDIPRFASTENHRLCVTRYVALTAKQISEKILHSNVILQ